MSIPSASGLELLLISLAGSGSTLTRQGGYKKREDGERGKGWGAIIRRRRLIEGRLLFEEIR